MSEKSCMDCKYMTESMGSTACKYTHGLKDWVKLLLLGPKPLFKTEPCEHFHTPAQELCKLYNKNITPSQYNAMGKCKCMGCTKDDCRLCYYVAKNCTACLKHNEKIK